MSQRLGTLIGPRVTRHRARAWISALGWGLLMIVGGGLGTAAIAWWLS